VSMRWGRTALCSLAVVAAVLFGSAPAASGGAPGAVARAAADAPPLSLVSQSNWVTPAQPWFNMTVRVGASEGSPATLRVSITYYSRLSSESQLQQAIAGSPSGGVLGRQPDIAVTSGGQAGGSTASSCVTVLRDSRDTPPSTGANACAPGPEALSIDMGCTPLTGECGDVYPVGVALYRQNSTTPLARLTTFLTYQEAGAPGSVGHGGPLNVGLVLPGSTTADTRTLATALANHPDVPTTLALNPAGVQKSETAQPKATSRALALLGSLSNEQVLDQPYEPIDVAAMSEAKIPGEIRAQMTRGGEILHAAGLRPTGGEWVDTASSFSQGDGTDLAAGLQQAGASQLVMSENDLTSAGVSNYTFAQPFNLDLGHGSTITAVSADSPLSARFAADPRDPVLSAEQLLAGLFWVHFENASLTQPRGVVIVPPANWHASNPFLKTLLDGLSPNDGLSQNDALKPVTLDQLFQVPVGGNREPAVRHLQGGPPTHGILHGAAVKIASARQQLSSYASAITGHVPSDVVTLSDSLLGTAVQGLSASRRAAALTSYERAFTAETGRITLAGQETVTFTARQASIPITVLSSAPYPVNVVVTLASDKFTFPNGNTRQLTLDRPTTSVRVTAQARTSGDRLPIDVTLHTQNGQLLLAQTVLTVHSTAISFVGVALTVLAGAVLLVWWGRTWVKARRKRLRAS
jgi:Family of unknown function (DUF6049)